MTMMRMRGLPWAVLVLMNSWTAQGFHRNVVNRLRLASSFRLQAHSLITATEALAEERSSTDLAYRDLQWFDPSTEQHDIPSDNCDSVTMPLYPLPAVYLPTTTMNHTLNNIEPRNIQMALDLKDMKDPLFCVALCAMDTGRLASIGTIMRVIDAQVQKDPYDPEQIARVVVTCVAEGTVDITGIENPQAASREYRLRRSSEYLRAHVRPRESESKEIVNEKIDDMLSQLAEDYNAVRDMYLNGKGTSDLPPFSLDTLSDSLPQLSLSNFTGPNFFKAAQIWQTLCYTVREGRNMRLAADRNEIMVESAIRRGGPLKLPIHMEDLTMEDRQEIERMELEAQRTWLNIGLDPCLDFQVLLSLTDETKRISFFRKMVSRERRRLEQLKDDSLQEEIRQEQPRKGAWFEDDWQ